MTSLRQLRSHRRWHGCSLLSASSIWPCWLPCWSVRYRTGTRTRTTSHCRIRVRRIDTTLRTSRTGTIKADKHRRVMTLNMRRDSQPQIPGCGGVFVTGLPAVFRFGNSCRCPCVMLPIPGCAERRSANALSAEVIRRRLTPLSTRFDSRLNCIASLRLSTYCLLRSPVTSGS